MLRMILLLAQVLFIFNFLCHQGQGDFTLVGTSKGLIRGLVKGETIRFLGIPYATVHERFQFPNLNTESWDGEKNATQPGPQCYQMCPGTEASLYCLPRMSEECLTLNVYRPAHQLGLGQYYPVIVYLHGGDFSTGSGGAAVYDGDYFSSKGRVIIVTINYRLGAFGFLSIFGKYGDATGNFGIRDQQAALAWVSQNIEYFQGDPNMVTIMGDGAGCASAVSHLASPSSHHLFHSAILHSCPLNIPYRNKTEARIQAEAFAKILDCRVNDVTCYRRKSPNEILRAQLNVRVNMYTSNPLLFLYPWGPSIDNDQVVYHPGDIFNDISRFANKPVLMGIVANEATAFVYKMFPLPLAEETFHAIIRQITPRPPNFFAPTDGDMRDTLAEFIQKYAFVCPTMNAAKQIVKKQTMTLSPTSSPKAQYMNNSENRVWMYEFFRPALAMTSLDRQQQMISTSALWASLSTTGMICERYSCHGSDVRALFNSDILPEFERRKMEPLSRLMVRYWSNFVRKDNVNGGITSRTHLRSLQLQSAKLSESPPMIMRSRAQRVSFLPLVRDTFSPVTSRIKIQSALTSFTFWDKYMSAGRQDTSIMLLQSPPLVVSRNQWESKCNLLNL